MVRGASSLAAKAGISPLVIGLTVVAFGTSAPELAISIQSGLAGEPDLLVGNVVGSNIFNILFTLGISALITPLMVARKLVQLDVPLMIGFSLLLYLFSVDGAIGRLEGLFLVAGLVSYIVFLVFESRKETEIATDDGAGKERHWGISLLFIVLGLGLLVAGARWLVESAVAFAEMMGLSSLVIGLTIVAAGTSLPEVATSIMASIKGERDIAVGNIVGSNIFNIMCIVGISATVLPDAIPVSAGVLGLDLPVMIAVAAACLPIFFTGHLIARWEGALFLAYYIIYTTYLVLTVNQHDLLPLINQAMIWFVLPITAVTLAVVSYREWIRRKGHN